MRLWYTCMRISEPITWTCISFGLGRSIYETATMLNERTGRPTRDIRRESLYMSVVNAWRVKQTKNNQRRENETRVTTARTGRLGYVAKTRTGRVGLVGVSGQMWRQKRSRTAHRKRSTPTETRFGTRARRIRFRAYWMS